METTTLQVETGARFAVVDLTDDVARWVRDRGDGLCHLLALHATAGLGLMETGSGSERDAQTIVDRLMPQDDGLYRHRHGRPGHGRDHVLPDDVQDVGVAVLAHRLVLSTDAHVRGRDSRDVVREIIAKVAVPATGDD